MNMSPVHQVWPKPSYKVQSNGEQDKADRRRDGKTTSKGEEDKADGGRDGKTT